MEESQHSAASPVLREVCMDARLRVRMYIYRDV